MIGPCVCTTTYFCVSCRVKRGDYRDWMTAPRRTLEPCSINGCERMATYIGPGLCAKHYEHQRVVNRRHYQNQHATKRRNTPIPNSAYIKLADR